MTRPQNRVQRSMPSSWPKTFKSYISDWMQELGVYISDRMQGEVKAGGSSRG